VSRQLVVVDSERLALLVLGPWNCGAVWTDPGAGGGVAVVGAGEFPSVVVGGRSCARAFSSSRAATRVLSTLLLSSASRSVKTKLVGVATAGSLLLPVRCLVVASQS
jgi:hypothetical protein